ncbi:hypothetical protein [Propionispora hippei]|uniref:Uncharacterized protein n=1 Tax=Propionispora hippei DSM 15287 TaxID=1123003 RepID=A0A1M6F3V6_9FIRM|nr:hypothetical protein [Propionispora hippei]SHI92361.1 hypothetical protein SAMN02745170_01357 [Propionispora hippei DSM 15287]
MASPEKIIKYVLGELNQNLVLLKNIAQDQNVVVAQNKQIIDLLSQILCKLDNRNDDTDEPDLALPEDTADEP